ncbi:MAG: HIT domain-containing protein [Patescibacteria group bacterium]
MACPFCDQDKLQVRLIYQDELIIAFPTNIPIVPGHTLICPRRHAATSEDLTEPEAAAIKNFLIRLKRSLTVGVGATGFNIAWNEGQAGSQLVDHLHIHVLPRKEGDSGIYNYDPRQFLYRPGARAESPEDELADIASVIRSNL